MRKEKEMMERLQKNDEYARSVTARIDEDRRQVEARQDEEIKKRRALEDAEKKRIEEESFYSSLDIELPEIDKRIEETKRIVGSQEEVLIFVKNLFSSSLNNLILFLKDIKSASATSRSSCASS